MRAQSAYRPRLLLILAGAVGLLLLGNARVPLWDRDEPRYAECSREMLQSGDWVVPRFLGELRTHKPPLIYWCQAAAMAVFGDTGQAARLPSTVAVITTAMLLAFFVNRFVGPRRALWATLIFCTSALVVAAAKFCITDGVLLLWIAIGQGCLFVLFRQRSLSAALLFWISTALAGLTKGPVVLGMHAATLVVFAFLDQDTWKSRMNWWTRLRPIIGILIIAIIVAPWLLLVNHRAPDFLPRLLNRAGRYASSGAEGHSQPPGFYLLLIWGLFFPWSLILPTSIAMGVRHRRRPFLRFALAAAIGPWIVMELVPNKLPFYILPSFPALAILTAEAIVRSSCARPGMRDDDLKRRSFLIGVSIWALAILAFGIGLRLAVFAAGGGGLAAIASIILGIPYAAIVLIAFIRRRIVTAASLMAGGMAVLIAALFGWILPSLPWLNTSRQIGQELNRLGAGGKTPVAMIDYREPSLAFYQGGGAREIDAKKLAGPTSPQWAVITTDGWTRLPPAMQANYEIIGSPYPTLIYNDGRQFKWLLIIHKRPG
jgi:hypothetical protein